MTIDTNAPDNERTRAHPNTPERVYRAVAGAFFTRDPIRSARMAIDAMNEQQAT